MVKVTALMVLKCSPDGSDPVILASASDLTSFGIFQRHHVREFVIFFGRTVAKRTRVNGNLSSMKHKTIDSVLERGEKLDSLVDKSSDLSRCFTSRQREQSSVVESYDCFCRERFIAEHDSLLAGS